MIKVTRNNITAVFDDITEKLSSAKIISIDTEFTGLGHENKASKAVNLQERYEALSHSVSSYAMISFGLAIFTWDNSNKADLDYTSYEFLLLPQNPFLMDPSSGSFLAKCGFDFNTLLLEGIRISTVDTDSGTEHILIKSIWNGIIRASRINNCSLVVHNGLMDLLYCYHYLFESLPPTIIEFVTNLSEMFSCGGIYDTKFIAQFELHEESTFLSFLYKKYEILEEYQIYQRVVGLNKAENSEITKRIRIDSSDICPSYSKYGTCLASDCQKKHDMSLLVKNNVVQKLNRQKAAEFNEWFSQNISDKSSDDVIHSASFDAMMTGLTFIRQEKLTKKEDRNWKNKLFLPMKTFPLLIEKSNFSPTSIKVKDLLDSIK